MRVLKLISACMILFMGVMAAPTPCSAQLTSKQEKALQKERDKMYKKLVKEYKQEGWKLADNDRTIEVAVLEHLAATSDKDRTAVIVGEVSKCKSANVGRQSALVNAQNSYAQMVGGEVKGRVSSMVGGDAENLDSEVDKFIAAFEKRVSVNVKGALQPSYSLVRDHGSYKEFKTFFILNYEKAGLACQRALEQSLNEVKLSNEVAKEISDFINEGITVE